MIPIMQIIRLMNRMPHMKFVSTIAIFYLAGMSITKSVNVRHKAITKKNAISLM